MSFIDKLGWPLITTLDEFLSRSDGVVHRPYRQYSHNTNPLCHASKGQRSFQVGQANGGLYVSCFGCNKGARNGFIDRVEDAMGVRIQAVYSDGSRRWRMPGETPAPPVERVPDELVPCAMGNEFTLNDLLESAVWFASDGNVRGWTGRYKGETIGYRHTINDVYAGGEDGVWLARNGGPYTDYKGQRVEVKPHRGRQRMQHIIHGLPGRNITPALSMAGSPLCPMPVPLLAVDCDYSPDKDEFGLGAQWRDALRIRLLNDGWPVFYSTSGNGFHALCATDSIGGVLNRNGKQTFQAVWTPPDTQGLAVEVFMPGARHSLTPKLDRPAADFDWNARLPMLSLQHINSVIAGE